MSKKECSEFFSIKRKYQQTTDTEYLRLYNSNKVINYFLLQDKLSQVLRWDMVNFQWHLLGFVHQLADILVFLVFHLDKGYLQLEDIQMFQMVDIQMFQMVDIQMFQKVDIQMFQKVDILMFQKVDIQMFQKVDIQIVLKEGHSYQELLQVWCPPM